jgi:predicted RND superfamily exporter protein
MESQKLIEIANDVGNKSNKDLVIVADELSEEFEKTKELIIDLTRHLDGVETLYNKVNKELEKRYTGK